MSKVDNGQHPERSNSVSALLGLPETLEHLITELGRLNSNLDGFRKMAAPLTTELGRLNSNIEGLQPTQIDLKDLIELLKDFREMAAPVLGFKVRRH